MSSEANTWIFLALVLIFWAVLFTLYEKRKKAGSYSQIKFGLIPVSIIVVLFLVGGGFLGYFYTDQHYEQKELNQTTKDQENLICEVRLQKGKMGDVKSDYFVFEQSAKEEDCQKFIDYKNLPDDTESFWLGF